MKNFSIIISDENKNIDILKVYDNEGIKLNDKNKNNKDCYSDYKINKIAYNLDQISKNLNSDFIKLEIKTQNEDIILKKSKINNFLVYIEGKELIN